MSIAGFDIRRGRCRRRGTKATVAPAIVGQSYEFNSGSGLFRHQNATNLVGNTGIFNRWVLFYVPPGYTAPVSNDYLWSYFLTGGGVDGWGIRVNTSGQLEMIVASGGGSYELSAPYTITASDKGKIHLAHYNALVGTANTVNQYFDTEAKGSTTSSLTSVTAPAAGAYLEVGGLSGYQSLAGIEILAVGGADGAVPTPYQIAQHYEACITAGTGTACGTTGELWWNVDSNPTAGTTWTDETATETLTKSGTVVVNDNTFLMDAISYATSGVTSSANVYVKAAGDTVFNGSTSMTVFFSGISRTKTATAWPSGNNYILSKTNGTGVARGWACRELNAGKPYIRGEFANGSGALVATPNADYSTVTNGNLMTCAVKLGSNVAHIHKQGVEVGTGTACVGYTAPSAADQVLIHTVSSFFNADWQLLGFGFCGSVEASDAQIAAWHTACLADPNGFAAMGLSGEILFRGEDVPTAGNWVNTGSTVTLTESGTVAHHYNRRTWS